MEMVNHTEESLASLRSEVEASGGSPEHRDGALLELHYGSLLQISKTLGMVMEQSTPSAEKQHNGEVSPPIPGMEQLERGLVRASASLMNVEHPVDFRIAYCEVISSVRCGCERVLVAVFALLTWHSCCQVTLAVPRFASLDTDATKALTSLVFDLFSDIAELPPVASPSPYSFPSMWRVAGALRVLLESSSASRRVVEAKRGLEFCLTSMKALFVVIRAEGGFGSARKTPTAADSRVLELSDRASVHMNVLGSLVSADAETQQLARTQRLPDVLLSNWNVIRAAHIRGSPLLSSAVRLLGNYTHRNDGTKASLAQQSLAPSASTAGDDRSLMSLLCDLAMPRQSGPSTRAQQTVSEADRRDAPIRIAACDVLSAAVLNSECRKWMVKFGAVAKLVDTVEERLKLAAQTQKTPKRVHAEQLGRLLGVLSSLASAEDGAAAIFASSSDDLALILRDILQSPERHTQTFGSLLLRNLALAEVAKTHAVVWEELLPFIVEACARHLREPPPSPSPSTSPSPVELLGEAVWSLVFDNQRLRASVLSRPALLRGLEEVVAAVSGKSWVDGWRSRREMLVVLTLSFDTRDAARESGARTAPRQGLSTEGGRHV